MEDAFDDILFQMKEQKLYCVEENALVLQNSQQRTRELLASIYVAQERTSWDSQVLRDASQHLQQCALRYREYCQHVVFQDDTEHLGKSMSEFKRSVSVGVRAASDTRDIERLLLLTFYIDAEIILMLSNLS